MVPSSENGRLGRIETKVDKVLESNSDIYRIIGRHEVKICAHEEDLKEQDGDIKDLSKTMVRFGVGIVTLLIAAVVASYLG
jgi:hypothetical protein